MYPGELIDDEKAQERERKEKDKTLVFRYYFKYEGDTKW